MKTLILLRHAEAGPYQADDHGRTLTAHGQAQARAAGAWLQQHDYKPDFYLCSTSARTRETLEGALASAGYKTPGEMTDVLYNRVPANYLQALRELGQGNTLLLVGHNPDICQLTMLLAGVSDAELQDFPKGSVVVMTANVDNWTDLRARNMTITGIFLQS